MSLAPAGTLERGERSGVDRSLTCGVVICGGESRRMGSDKALLELGGLTLLERAVEVLQSACASKDLS